VLCCAVLCWSVLRVSSGTAGSPEERLRLELVDMVADDLPFSTLAGAMDRGGAGAAPTRHGAAAVLMAWLGATDGAKVKKFPECEVRCGGLRRHVCVCSITHPTIQPSQHPGIQPFINATPVCVVCVVCV
jgi:hypothetical protein